VVTNYTITSGNDSASYPERNPANWRLLASNDGTTWTTLDTQTSQTFTASQQTLAYNIASPAAYNIYKLVIDSVANPTAATCVQLDEIQLLGAPLYSYFWSLGDGTTSTAQNPQHTYTNNGTYTAVLGVSYGIYTGTNTMAVTVGPPLTATATATPTSGSAPLVVQFTGLGSGGRGSLPAYDTTDDHLGTITAQGQNTASGEVAANAFDNSTTTKWLDYATNTPLTRASWIQYQYGSGLQYAVSTYTITSANDHLERAPWNWHLLGSNNGGSSWATLDIQTNQTFTAYYQKLTYNIPNTTAYNIYRLQIDSVAATNANSVQLSEIEFITVPTGYAYSWLFGDGTTSTAQNPQHTYTNNGIYTVAVAVWDGLSTVTNTMTVSTVPPTLAVWPAGAGNLTMSWPAWAANCHLYATTNLVSPISWSLVTNTVTTNGGNCNVTVPTGPGTRFFQLRSP
jgi:PKD repeat protein